MIVRKDLLISSFFNGNQITIPVLDKESFNIFFDHDDILSERINGIHSIGFSYNKVIDKIACKINYNIYGVEYLETNSDKYFIYDEITDPSCITNFQERLEKYAHYMDSYFSKCYDERISKNEKGLELSFITEFFEMIGWLGQYLIPKEDILKELSSDYVITHKKFC